MAREHLKSWLTASNLQQHPWDFATVCDIAQEFSNTFLKVWAIWFESSQMLSWLRDVVITTAAPCTWGNATTARASFKTDYTPSPRHLPPALCGEGLRLLLSQLIKPASCFLFHIWQTLFRDKSYLQFLGGTSRWPRFSLDEFWGELMQKDMPHGVSTQPLSEDTN